MNKKYDAKKTSFVLKKHDIDRIHDVLKGVTRITNADVQPDGTYEWIAHMEDHNGEYHAIWAQKHKEGKKINK